MSDQKNKSWKESLKSRKYDEHKHCLICNRAIPLEKDFCSSECKQKFTDAEKGKGKKNTIQLVMLIAFMVIAMIILPRILSSLLKMNSLLNRSFRKM